MLTTTNQLATAGIDALAVKPTKVDITRIDRSPFDELLIDYEGTDSLPSLSTLERLAADGAVRQTVPVRATGFDPLGDDRHLQAIGDVTELSLVAGHPAYLDHTERRRAIGPRLGAAMDQFDDCWVGTEGIERLALATDAVQYELLSPTTTSTVASLRAAGMDVEVAVYAPVVPTDDEDVALEALGSYLARRASVAADLKGDQSPGAAVTGSDREVLLDALDGYALWGTTAEIADSIQSLRDAGVTHIVGYHATMSGPS